MFVGGSGSYDDVDEEMDVSDAHFLVSEANIFVSEALKLCFYKFIYVYTIHYMIADRRAEKSSELSQ